MTALLTHQDCIAHEVPRRHPESSARIHSILQHLKETGLLQDVSTVTPDLVAYEHLTRVHTEAYVENLKQLSPDEGLVRLDIDTAMGPTTLSAARRAAGATTNAVDLALQDVHRRSFCVVRPPGHHAETDHLMGFCLFNSIAVAADYALDRVSRVAVLDFDVHHGNGTVEIFADRPEVLVCSSFQYPCYPYRLQEIERSNIVNTPLPEGTGSREFRLAIERDWISAIEKHKPELFLVSAGFDAHQEDPFAGLSLVDDDYRWITNLIVDLSKQFAGGRVVSTLEGGYELNALARSAKIHLEALL
ncbi:MAG: histone deacetylase family protein [Gammaproteobacteria bacterium]|nr:histone deacetylase family protein [Gammaproteobacteria bacterium]MYF02019.1 histone deacetylase family protein [Gammaproteobacteria bacterium]